MAIQLNHTIAWCSDRKASSEFLASVLGLPSPRRFMHFLIVDLANDVSIDYFETDEHLTVQHFAFLVSDAEFDDAFARISERGIDFGPIRRVRSRARSINTLVVAEFTFRTRTGI